MLPLMLELKKPNIFGKRIGEQQQTQERREPLLPLLCSPLRSSR
jgi:hypothetical protein